MTNVEKLILDNMGLAVSIASKFHNKFKYEYEDVQQVAYEGLIRAAKKYDDSLEVQFSTWAYPIIQNWLYYKFRPKASKKNIKVLGYDDLVDVKEDTYSLEELLASDFNTEKIVLGRELKDVVYQYIDELPQVHREALLYFIDGKSYNEISQLLGLKKSIVTSFLKQARTWLKVKIKRRGL